MKSIRAVIAVSAAALLAAAPAAALSQHQSGDRPTGTARGDVSRVVPASGATSAAAPATPSTAPSTSPATTSRSATAHPSATTAGTVNGARPAAAKSAQHPSVAAAQPKAPKNDTARKATVAAVPSTARLDVAGATLDSLESGLAADCGFPATDRAVWYRVDDPAGKGFVVDASGSDHPVGIAMLGGDPRDNVLMGCSRGAVLTASGGPSGPFYLAVLSDAGATTTHLRLVLRDLPTPTAAVTLDSVGALEDGGARLTGSYSCQGTGTPVTVTISGRLSQSGNEGISSPVDGVCDGATHPWSLLVSGPTAFQSGAAQGVVTASACAGPGCATKTAEGTVTLS